MYRIFHADQPTRLTKIHDYTDMENTLISLDVTNFHGYPDADRFVINF